MQLRPCVILLSIFILASFSCQNSPQHSSPAALFSEPPDKKARMFAPGIISTDLYERDFTMTPDKKEMYWRVVVGDHSYSAIMMTKYDDEKWSKPEVAPFSKNPEYKDMEPFITYHGEKFYFVSNRPSKNREENWDIWVMDRQKEGWGEPYNLGAPVNSDAREFFPSLTKDGTLYFTREGQNVENGIFRCRFSNGQYQKAERLPEQVNAGKARYNALIDPDENFIIVPIYGMEDTRGGTDYYICFRNHKDQWSQPINMGDEINSYSGAEWSASLSQDGQFIFFMTAREEKGYDFKNQSLTYQKFQKLHRSPNNGNPNIYWINSSIIDSLEKIAEFEYL